ncbi:MAG: ABC transporter permease subunit [Candidatus Thermoplasmatota archaeon]|jgi:ABC-2 type transport system permease protein
MSAWRTMASQELRILWLGGRAPLLLTLFAVAFSALAFLFATNKELSLIPPRETLYLLSSSSIAVGLLVSLILGADSVSGERDRGSLEALLLTPANRRDLVLGKYLAALSPWPAILVLLAPFLYQLSPNLDSFIEAMMWTVIMGTIVVAGFTAFGVLVSIRAGSNKTSLGIALVTFLLFMIPTQLPGTAQTGGLGLIMKKMNPLESAAHFLEKMLVNNRTPGEMAVFLLAPVLFLVVCLAILTWQRNPTLKLRAGGE